ncbi:hypothetical protein NQ315_005254 [Exocentrus adspersus]|uniref:Uncharacterized protein n=1 Tax=Exocentrus adspersus TaxID=1586481 RepID=A0AAV8W1K7_9CUCU|nr:hypothetical protein NQ315_005254 [Exocentrus adspersus]
MKLLILACFVAATSAGLLPSAYLPPVTAPAKIVTPVSTAYFYRAPVAVSGYVPVPAVTTTQVLSDVSTPASTQSPVEVPAATTTIGASANVTSAIIISTTQSSEDVGTGNDVTPTVSSTNPQGNDIPSSGASSTQISGVSSPTVLYGVPLAPVQTYQVPVTAPVVPIVRYNFETNGQGNYRYDYETANHIAAQESGALNSAGSNEVQGAYSYLAPSGEIISLSYIAGETGFVPEGAHLPTPPPTPEAILRSLEINAAAEARRVAEQSQVSAQLTSGNLYLPPAQTTAQALEAGYRY